MADLTNVLKYFPVPSETYTNNLSASISAGAVTVPVNANNEYTDGDVVVLTVDPGTTNEATFTGVKASSPARFTNCVWTEGNLGVGHASGVTITDYDSATHVAMITKGIKKFANDDGTLKTTAVQAALNISAAVPSDYTSLAQTATTIVPNGNRSYTMTFPGVNYTDRLSPGMRIRTVRSTPAPTQCASLNGTTQYFSKTSPAGMTFTDDFTVSAWVKLSSYTGDSVIASRHNGTSGWYLDVLPTGQVVMNASNGGGSNFSQVSSYQSIPLNKWVHIAAQLDMSAFTATATTSYIMVDGVDIPASVARSGTNPTALIQAGNLEIGSNNGGSNLFEGKIAQVAIFDSKVTQATMRGYMSQGLAGTEPTLISAYSFNNVITDLNTTNANNLTANGGVVATNADSPFGTQGDGTISATVDYGIIQKVTYGAPDTTVVLQVPEGNTIPSSGGVASVSYSQFKAPYGFPGDEDKYTLSITITSSLTINSPVANTTYNPSGFFFTAPIGKFILTHKASLWTGRGAAGLSDAVAQLGTSTVTNPVVETTIGHYTTVFGASDVISGNVSASHQIDNAAAQNYYIQLRTTSSGISNLSYRGDVNGPIYIKLKNAHL